MAYNQFSTQNRPGYSKVIA